MPKFIVLFYYREVRTTKYRFNLLSRSVNTAKVNSMSIFYVISSNYYNNNFIQWSLRYYLNTFLNIWFTNVTLYVQQKKCLLNYKIPLKLSTYFSRNRQKIDVQRVCIEPSKWANATIIAIKTAKLFNQPNNLPLFRKYAIEKVLNWKRISKETTLLRIILAN